MPGFSDYAEQQILQHAFGISSWTAQTAWHIKLHTGDPGEAGASNELAGNGYAPVNNTSWAWDSGNSRIKNSALVRFDDLPSATVTHISIHSAATAGNCLAMGALAVSKVVALDSSLEFAIDTIQIELN